MINKDNGGPGNYISWHQFLRRTLMLYIFMQQFNYNISMKWITREHPKIDRIAYDWLIKCSIDNKKNYL